MAVRFGRGHKYGAKRCVVHDGKHASLKECRRAIELQLMERAGAIRHLQEQVRIDLCHGQCVHPRHIVYVADFCYEERNDDGTFTPRWEDAKGFQTDVFKLKRHMLADQGIQLRLT